jgi:hypothetical protein
MKKALLPFSPSPCELLLSLFSHPPRLPVKPSRLLLALAVAAATATAACKGVSRFTATNGERFEGPVAAGSFVRAGTGEGVRMCLTLDADHLQDAPGAITTSDGRFRAVPLRPIPQIWHDPLSTLKFGDGRVQNLVYVATPTTAGEADAMVIVSLMESDAVEVRLLRGAPPVDAGATGAEIFGVWNLDRQTGPCAF